jgi:hypothetical protein
MLQIITLCVVPTSMSISKPHTTQLGLQQIPVQVSKPKTSATQLHIEFTLRWTQYQWMNKLSQLNTIPCDDGVPVVSKVIISNLHSGLSSVEMDYKPGGIRVVYKVHQLTDDFEPNEFTTNTAGNNGDVRPVDAIKMFCFTKAPPTICSQLTKTITEIPVQTQRANNLHCFLSSGFIAIEDLGTCLQGGGKPPLNKAFLHNFTPQGTQFEISDAVVHINGMRCTSGEHLRNALITERNEGRMRTSMMHTMPERSDIINANLQLLGQSVANGCDIRGNSIGHMMHRPISLGLMHQESLPMYMMGNMYKSDFGSICPELAVHLAAQSHNITGNTPHDADVGPPLFKTYTPARLMTTAQVMSLLHTSYQAPCFAAELTPYTSDRVLNISPETVTAMCTGSFGGVFKDNDFVLTECIDNAFNVPNDSQTFRANDCEGSAAMLITMQNNMRAVFYDATRHLSNCHTPEGQQALSAWLGRCNVNIPTNMQYAFAVQLTALSAVAHMATDLKTVLVGAQCATPLQSGAPNPLDVPVEQGHCCCMMQANEANIGPIVGQVYKFYNSEANKGITLKLPTGLNGVTYTGKQATSETTKIAPTNTRTLHKDNLKPCILSDELLKKDYHILGAALASNFPHNDIASISKFYIVESTTALHWCPVRGHIAVAKMRNVIPRTPFQLKNDLVNPNMPLSVPIEEFAKDWLLKDVRPYITTCEDVRLEGFLHSTSDVATALPFYKSLYQMDTFALHQIHENGRLQIGADAMQLLTNITNPSVKLTLEKIQLPCLTAAENEDIWSQMHAQWNETRLPSLGRRAVCANLASWHPATINANHAPENRETGVLRCNISISGDSAAQLYTDMSPGGSRAQQFAADDHGMIADMRVIAMGKNTTILSQSIRVTHLMQSTDKATAKADI